MTGRGTFLLGLTAALVVLSGSTIIAYLATARPATGPVAAPPEPGPTITPVYTHAAASALVHHMFPQTVRPSGIARALADPKLMNAWRTVDDVVTGQTAAQLPVSGFTAPIRFAAPPLESYWLIAAESREHAQRLILATETARLRELMAQLVATPQPWANVIEKALLQRDAFHVLSILVLAREQLEDQERQGLDPFLRSFSDLIVRKLLLTTDELAELRRQAGAHCDRRGFCDRAGSLSENYLPRRALAEDATWWPMDVHLKYHVHYNKYRGRSFFKTFARIPGMTHEDFRSYWRSIAVNYGSKSNTVPTLPRLPAGSEFLLLRTLGVLLDDGTIADSEIREEVLIRRLVTRDMSLDRETSDLRGTQHYQYLLDRQKYLASPRDPGLRRVADDEPAYLGFFPGAPDFQTSWNEHVTSARFNCIICHSESQYGAATVFSLGFEEVRKAQYLYLGHPFAEYVSPDRARLNTPEAQLVLGRISER